MNSALILSYVTFIYGAAALFYIIAWIFNKSKAGSMASFLWILAVSANLIGFLLRWRESYQMGIGRIPLSNLYESLVFFALTMGFLYIFIERRFRIKQIGVFFAPLVFLFMAYASLSPHVSSHIRPLVPALKSNWLTVHVITCFLGYAGFALAFVLSLMYLVKIKRKNFISFPDAAILDDLSYKMIAFGFLFLSLGIITGSVWANSAWGSYWSWDPKETWSLITWIVYAFLMHARLMRSWNGVRIAWLSILGFMAVMFTYFGVNFLPGLHSYGSF